MLYTEKEVVIISFNKDAAIIIFSFALLIGAVLWSKIDESADSVRTVVVKKSAVTTSQTEKSTMSVTDKTESVKISDKTLFEKITVSTKISEKTTVISEYTTKPEILYIDINSADSGELILLDGIGEYLAGQIIAYREENGDFKNIEELINVSGIGEKIFDSIRDYVYVENPIYDTEEMPEESDIIDTEVTAEEIMEVTMNPEGYMPVNLNEADIERLLLLPCIDVQTAENIIELREELGGFTNVYELLYIENLTEMQFSEIIEYVCI
ncbi:MAG: helix-hairpin-helix domain-containing protein [Ruminococcus sp.]|nr:helix-hairpin-helix domain-containing protein [Ruminococcus sp.]